MSLSKKDDKDIEHSTTTKFYLPNKNNLLTKNLKDKDYKANNWLKDSKEMKIIKQDIRNDKLNYDYLNQHKEFKELKGNITTLLNLHNQHRLYLQYE